MILAEKLYVNLRHGGRKDNSADEKYFVGEIKKKREVNVTELSLDIQLIQCPYGYARYMDAKTGIFADITLAGEIFGVLSRNQYNPFWSKPEFEKDLSRISDNIQNMLVKIDAKYLAILPVINNDFNVTIEASDRADTVRFCISMCYDGAYIANGTFAVLAVDDNPVDAVCKSFEYAYDNGLIKTHLRNEKKLNAIYNGLGWCTWNAFYHDVCEEAIFQKLEEFKSKEIPIKWVMIDDGWMQASDKEQFALESFVEDKKKFPNGLKACIEKMKSQYAIEHVGVWHTLMGYWFGVEKHSELYYKHKDRLIKTKSGLYIPDGEKAYEFFCDWYSYLKEQGVDFVKIDAQGNALEYYWGMNDCIRRCIELQSAVDKAVNECFGGNVINCMGMNNINSQNRPYTSLSRNSDDFYPDKPESFTLHIMQNAYNAVFQSQLYFCDYDMWQTYDFTAKQSSVLRAISGGPVYLSDGLERTEDKYIRPLIDDDGNVILCDNCAIPMTEHLTECPKNKVLKLINKKDDGFVVAVFNLSCEKKKVAVSLNEAPNKYIAYSYFGKVFYKCLSFDIEIDAFDAEIINFYLIDNGVVHTGDLDKYISIGNKYKRKINEIWIARK